MKDIKKIIDACKENGNYRLSFQQNFELRPIVMSNDFRFHVIKEMKN